MAAVYHSVNQQKDIVFRCSGTYHDKRCGRVSAISAGICYQERIAAVDPVQKAMLTSAQKTDKELVNDDLKWVSSASVSPVRQ